MSHLSDVIEKATSKVERKINLIVIHCSATTSTQDIGVKEIRKWHTDKGWADIGYHFVIRRNGVLELGRPVQQAGAHAQGYNANSIGICMVGGVDRNNQTNKLVAVSNFTPPQWATLGILVRYLLSKYKVAVIGHRQVSNKACPSFSVDWWMKQIGITPGLEWKKQ